ncbi:MAG TPA: hypothetical protein VNQ97_02555 [Burkholderiaceae bacterium]|nr:hypothetical protein [Burkholderiaceae bacterium]
MSDLSYNQYSRLSDSLERDLMRDAMSNGESVSVITLGKTVLRSLKNGFMAVADYLVEVTDALDEARAKDARFSRSQW